jgi:hypothetical protein
MTGVHQKKMLGNQELAKLVALSDPTVYNRCRIGVY